MIVAERDGTVLRYARKEDMPRIDRITVLCYRAIHESYVRMLGEERYQAVRHAPHLTQEERKTDQVHRLFSEHPDWVWILEQKGAVIGFVTSMLFPSQSYGRIDNNGVDPKHAGKGWGRFMYQLGLEHFRDKGLRFAHVDTGLDAAHIQARRAYESVGLDHKVPTVEQQQDLNINNLGSVPDQMPPQRWTR